MLLIVTQVICLIQHYVIYNNHNDCEQNNEEESCTDEECGENKHVVEEGKVQQYFPVVLTDE